MPLPNQEILVLNALKYFQAEYQEGVPVNILKLDLDLSDEDLKDILGGLDKKGVIFIEDERIRLVKKDISTEESEKDLVEDISKDIPEDFSKDPTNEKQNLKKEDLTPILSKNEIKVYNTLKGQSDVFGYISVNLVEGYLLYGDLKLSTKGCYNLISSLENKGIINKVHKVNGDYYQIK